MAILKIAQLGHPVLRQVSSPIDPEHISSPPVQALIQDMLDTMEDYGGVGLAAPQVHYPVRVVILEVQEEQRVLINPEIEFLTEETVSSYEGCLSVHGMRARVHRCAKVRVRAFNEKAEQIEFVVEDFDAIVVQHECDHLDGVLYIDRCVIETLAFVAEYRRWGGLDEGPVAEGEE